MIRHLKHVQLIRLKEHLSDTGEFCDETSLRLKELFLVGGQPIDLKDKATQQFFELMSFDPGQFDVDLSEFRRLVISRVDGFVDEPTSDLSSAFQAFLAQGDVDGSWTQLNGLYQLLTGSDLSVIVDVSDVLMSPDDKGLDGDEWYAANLELARLDGDQSSLFVFGVAIASSLEQLLLLTRDEVLQREDSYRSLRKKRIPSTQYVSSDLPERFEPAYVFIQKNDVNFIHVPVSERQSHGGFDLRWERASFPNDRATTQVIAAVATKSVGSKLKGRLLYEELGL
jgi:hypothetical protein